MAAAVRFSIDDRDLDDAELWAVIDSASAAAAGSRKPLLALKNSPSAAPNSSPAPLKPFRNPRRHHSSPALGTAVVEELAVRVPPDGEVVQGEQWAAHQRPQKMARFVEPVAVGDDRRMVVVRQPARAQVAPVSSPSYRSPDPGRFALKELCPVVESPSPGGWETEERKNHGQSFLGLFPSVASFKQYQNAAMAILEKSDYTMISGSPFIKKSGWRKISFFFNLSFEIKDKSIEFDENRDVQRAEFVVRAFMQGGRFADGWGSCERREKRFLKPNHDIPSTAETRAKNKASQDLLGIGQYRSSAVNGLR